MEYFGLAPVFMRDGAQWHGGRSLVSVFQRFSASIKKFLFWRGNWALGYHFMGFRHFPDVS